MKKENRRTLASRRDRVLEKLRLFFEDRGCYVGVVALKSYFCKVGRRCTKMIQNQEPEKDAPTWEWLDRKTNPESIVMISGIGACGIGPCGRPMDRFASSPQWAGLACTTLDISRECRSDIWDCSRCPMNPNRT